MTLRRGAAARKPVALAPVPEFLVPRRKPDPALPLMAAAFALGVVIASVAALGMRISHGETVPARVHRVTLEQLAAAQATRSAQDARLTAQAAALDDADALARRLIAALDAPRTSAAEIAALRSAVDRQITRIERTRTVVPGPVVTVTPAPGARSTPPQAARPSSSAPPPASPSAPAADRGCEAEVLGVCLVPRA